MRKHIISAMALLCAITAAAQENYTIYPVPHQQDIEAGTADFSASVSVVTGPQIDAATYDRAVKVLQGAGLKAVRADKPSKSSSNVILGVAGSGDSADRLARKYRLDGSVFSLDKYDRHILCLRNGPGGLAQVVILGEDTDAAFCGLASLEQILDKGTSDLNCVTICDYADIQNRGIIEGYYGVPYSAAVTKDLFEFMARYKLNTYMYGAKSDPYHSRFWDEPYPVTITADQERIGYLSQDMLREITDVAHACKVNFIWAIHPGQAFMDEKDTEVNTRIMNKLESMYGLGVRQFGVFVDDVGVPYDAPTQKLGADRLTDLQNRIDAKWNIASAAPEDMVKPLHYVPQLYAYSWTSRENARKFFESLSPVPSKVNIYITGAAVWSVPNNGDLGVVKDFLGRPTSWWWNYPCNDNDMTKIFPMDMYTNFKDERHIDNLARLKDGLDTKTLIINPMQQGEISKISLFSVGDYAWNMGAFDNERSWEAAIPATVGKDMAPALRFLAPYLRYFDADALAYCVNGYKESVAEGRPRPGSVKSRLGQAQKACETLEMLKTEDPLFYNDIKPWLLKFKAMAAEAISLLDGNAPSDIDFDNDPDFQLEILNGMGEDISLSKVTAEPAAQVLMPFIKWLRENR